MKPGDEVRDHGGCLVYRAFEWSSGGRSAYRPLCITIRTTDPSHACARPTGSSPSLQFSPWTRSQQRSIVRASRNRTHVNSLVGREKSDHHKSNSQNVLAPNRAGTSQTDDRVPIGRVSARHRREPATAGSTHGEFPARFRCGHAVGKYPAGKTFGRWESVKRRARVPNIVRVRPLNPSDGTPLRLPGSPPARPR